MIHHLGEILQAQQGCALSTVITKENYLEIQGVWELMKESDELRERLMKDLLSLTHRATKKPLEITMYKREDVPHQNWIPAVPLMSGLQKSHSGKNVRSSLRSSMAASAASTMNGSLGL